MSFEPAKIDKRALLFFSTDSAREEQNNSFKAEAGQGTWLRRVVELFRRV